MIVFFHTKFGLVRIQGSGVKGGGGGGIRPSQVWASFSNPGPDRVKEILNNLYVLKAATYVE